MTRSVPRGNPISTFRTIERQGRSRGSWNAMAQRWSMPTSAPPSMSTSPELGASSPMTCRSSVDFPQPEGPMSATISPGETSSVTSVRTRRDGTPRSDVAKDRLTPRSDTDSAGALAGRAGEKVVTPRNYGSDHPESNLVVTKRNITGLATHSAVSAQAMNGAAKARRGSARSVPTDRSRTRRNPRYSAT